MDEWKIKDEKFMWKSTSGKAKKQRGKCVDSNVMQYLAVAKSESAFRVHMWSEGNFNSHRKRELEVSGSR